MCIWLLCVTINATSSVFCPRQQQKILVIDSQKYVCERERENEVSRQKFASGFDDSERVKDLPMWKTVKSQIVTQLSNTIFLAFISCFYYFFRLFLGWRCGSWCTRFWLVRPTLYCFIVAFCAQQEEKQQNIKRLKKMGTISMFFGNCSLRYL